MRVQDVEQFWRRQAAATDDPDETEHQQGLHYLAALSAIANGCAEPDPAALAQAVLRGVAGPVAGDCQTPEVRYVQSSDRASSGDGTT